MVSIIVPCYNHERFIKDCLQSLINQTYEDIELLINDDCSVDHSWKILCEMEETLKKRFVNVYLHRNTRNKGVVNSCNHLLKRAQGTYIKVLASDDLLQPNYIGRVVKFMDDYKQYDAVVTNGKLIPEDQRYPVYNEEGQILYPSEPNLKNDGLIERIYKDNYIAAPATMVRRSVYDQIGPFDSKLVIEDWEYWLRMLHHDMRFGFLDENLCCYRQNSQSATAVVKVKGLEKRRIRILRSELRIIDKYRQDVEREIYKAKREKCVLSQYYIAVNNKLPLLKLYSKIEMLKNKII